MSQRLQTKKNMEKQLHFMISWILVEPEADIDYRSSFLVLKLERKKLSEKEKKGGHRI